MRLRLLRRAADLGIGFRLIVRWHIVSLCVLGLGVCLFIAPAASAVNRHLFQGTIHGAGYDKSGPLENPLGTAIDQSAGDVYATDSVHDTVDKFNASTGELVPSFAHNGILESNSTASGRFIAPWGLAVDQSTGSLYVANLGVGVVEKFSSTGAIETAFGNNGELSGSATQAGFFSPIAVAVDQANNDIYVADNANRAIAVYSSTGVFQFQFSSDEISGPTDIGFEAAR